MSKLKFLLAIFIVGCIAFIISHFSFLKQYGTSTLHVINQVHFHAVDSRSDNEDKPYEVKKSFRGNKPVIELEAGKSVSFENPLQRTEVAVEQAGVHDTKVAEAKNTVNASVAENHDIIPLNESAVHTRTLTSHVQLESGIELSKGELPLCNEFGTNLVGPLYVDQTVPKDFVEIEKELSVAFGGVVERGGWFSPAVCKPRKKVAIIIPYRNRYDQLKVFLRHLHPILQRQQLFYRIIVVEQMDDDQFNRAGLFNIGYAESLKMGDFNCFVFSDVDLLPEDDRNYYGCPTSPRHMSVAVDKFDYRLPYDTIFGGVGAFIKDHFEEINGMSNMFWGWGGEDDDLFQRITEKGYQLTRPSMQIGRYTMIKQNHFQSSKAGPDRMNLLKSSRERMVADGLNSLKYELRKIDEDPLVTFVRVKLSRSMYVD